MIEKKSFKNLNNNILLHREGYLATTATFNRSSMQGATPNDEGRYIIPKGTFICGSEGTPLLQYRDQIAKVVDLSGSPSTLTIQSAVIVTANKSGTDKVAIALVKPATAQATTTVKVEYKGTAPKYPLITVSLANDGVDVVATAQDVVGAINGDIKVNSILRAKMVSSDPYEVMNVLAEAELAGGTAPGDESTVKVDGVLVHDVDITSTTANVQGTFMYSGDINLDRIPEEPSEVIKAKLPRISFGRID